MGNISKEEREKRKVQVEALKPVIKKAEPKVKAPYWKTRGK